MFSRIRLLIPGHTNPNQIEATKAKRIEVAMRIEPKTSTALPIIRCTLSTELQAIEKSSQTSTESLKNPRRQLRQYRSKSYFAVDGKIDTTLQNTRENLHEVVVQSD